MTAHVDPVRLDASVGDERKAALAHAAGCRDCRRAIASHDPALLFALLSDTPVPQHVLDAVSAGTSRRLGEPAGVSRMPAIAAAVAAAAIVSGALLLRPELPPTAVPALAVVPRAGVEVQGGAPVSQVVDFTIGDTQVVMVYNPELEL